MWCICCCFTADFEKAPVFVWSNFFLYSNIRYEYLAIFGKLFIRMSKWQTKKWSPFELWSTLKINFHFFSRFRFKPSSRCKAEIYESVAIDLILLDESFNGHEVKRSGFLHLVSYFVERKASCIVIDTVIRRGEKLDWITWGWDEAVRVLQFKYF